MEPAFKEASSGLNALTTETRCSAVMPSPPPVVVQTLIVERFNQ